MNLPNDKIENISHLVIQVLYSRFLKFPSDSLSNRNAPFHEAFLNAFTDKLDGKVIDIPFFLSMSSWLHGLNTTMGQTFFERAAHILSNGEKREYTAGRQGNLSITSRQKTAINTIMTDLNNSLKQPNLKEENKILFKKDETQKVNALGFSVDVFIEDMDEIIAIELKSVRPNYGEMRGEKQKILEGKTALYHKFPNKNIRFYIGFPFDPTDESHCNSDKIRFMNSIIGFTKYFHMDEVLLASELWDLLSGTPNTMEELLEIINNIATTDFWDTYSFLNDGANRQFKNYKTYLQNWNLYSEIFLLDNENKILNNIKNNSALVRTFNQEIFKDGKYNWNRFIKLKNVI